VNDKEPAEQQRGPKQTKKQKKQQRQRMIAGASLDEAELHARITAIVQLPENERFWRLMLLYEPIAR